MVGEHRGITSRPTVILVAVMAALLVVGFLFWKAGGTPKAPAGSGVVPGYESTASPNGATTQQPGSGVKHADVVRVTTPKDRPLRMTFLGDAITMGAFTSVHRNDFASLVTRWFSARLRAASSTSGLLSLTSSEALRMRTPTDQDVVVVFVGTYDFYGPSPQRFLVDYPRLVRRVRAQSPGAKIICVTPWLQVSRGEDYVRTVLRTCSGGGGTVVNLSTLLDDQTLRAQKGDRYWGGTAPYSGLPNDRGHRAIAGAIEHQVRIVR